MIQLDSRDQPLETPAFCSTEIAHQYATGLLSLLEAEVFDILIVQGVFSSFNTQRAAVNSPQSPGEREPHPAVLLSQIHLTCLWEAIPILQQWISQFLSSRQPDVVVIAGKKAEISEKDSVIAEPEAFNGLLIIGSSLQDLHGTLAERIAEHLFSEGQITGYSVYPPSIDSTGNRGLVQ